MSDYELFLSVLMYDIRELERAVKKQKKELIHRKLVDVRAGCERVLESEVEEDVRKPDTENCK